MSASVSTSSVPKRRVFVVGVGMTKFEKPGKQSWDYPDMGEQAAKRALQDAGLNYNQIEQACIGYVYGDSTAGQRALYTVGLTGIPIYNVNNNCSTGSSALFMAKQLVQGGIANCVMALGFEKMERGSLGLKYTDRVNPLDRHAETMTNLRGFSTAPPAPQMFGNAGREHMEKYGTTKEQFAKIAVKNHLHSKNNPYSQFRDEYTLDQVLKSPNVYEPLTKLQCCPTSDGAACVIVCSEEFVKAHNLESQAVEVVAMAMRTDFPTSFENSCIKMVGFDMSKAAADAVYKEAGVAAKDVQVIELHDCFSCNELLTYEALGLCKVGDGGKLIDNGEVTYGGKWVVNPSGGLISKGHPLGATGLAQCSELCWQLRKMAGPRQVPNVKMALQHNIGLGGAAVVGLYRLGFPEKFKEYPKNKKNYAIEADDTPVAQGSTPEFKSAAIFRLIAQALKLNTSLTKSINGVFQFDIVQGGSTQSWTVDAKNEPGCVASGAKNGAANVVIEMSDSDFVGMMTGKLSARDLMAENKLKLAGEMTLAMKLRELASAIANLPQAKL